MNKPITDSEYFVDSRCIYYQIYNRMTPSHETGLEGTRKFPVCLLGYLTSLDIGRGVIRGWTLYFSSGTLSLKSLGFWHSKNKIISLYIPPEEGLDNFYLVRKGKITKETEVTRYFLSKGDERPMAIEYEWIFEVV